MNRVKKEIILGMVFSFILAGYQLYVEEPYYASIEATGRTAGLFEVALGFFGLYFVIRFVQWVFTREPMRGGH